MELPKFSSPKMKKQQEAKCMSFSFKTKIFNFNPKLQSASWYSMWITLDYFFPDKSQNLIWT